MFAIKRKDKREYLASDESWSENQRDIHWFKHYLTASQKAAKVDGDVVEMQEILVDVMDENDKLRKRIENWL